VNHGAGEYGRGDVHTNTIKGYYSIFKSGMKGIYQPDVSSKDHVILQGLDIILGAIQFRLNDKHLEIPQGKKRRSKRTVAKEEVYKYINSRIGAIYPNFNIGVSTATGRPTDNIITSTGCQSDALLVDRL
jgi:hypothetical protein